MRESAHVDIQQLPAPPGDRLQLQQYIHLPSADGTAGKGPIGRRKSCCASIHPAANLRHWPSAELQWQVTWFSWVSPVGREEMDGKESAAISSEHPETRQAMASNSISRSAPGFFSQVFSCSSASRQSRFSSPNFSHQLYAATPWRAAAIPCACNQSANSERGIFRR